MLPSSLCTKTRVFEENSVGRICRLGKLSLGGFALAGLAIWATVPSGFHLLPIASNFVRKI